MGEIISKIIFFIFVLPTMMLSHGYGMFKVYMSKGNHAKNFPYVLLSALVILLLVLLAMGYR